MPCFNSVVIAASADKVWARIRNFHDFSWAPNVITKVDTEGDPEVPGSKRVLNDVFFETLLKVDDDNKVVRYSIDDGPEVLSKDKVQGYMGVVRVYPVTADDSSYVLWTSSWESSEGGVEELCNPIYRALLADLQQQFV